MFTKSGFIVLVLLFGALMFAGGVLAPASWHARLEQVVSHKLPVAAATHTAVAAPDGSKSAAPAAATAATPAAASSQKPIPYEKLLLPITPPDSARYALQVALLPDRATADGLKARITALGYPVLTVPVAVTGETWFAVLAGEYPSPAEAGRDRPRLQQQIGAGYAMVTLMLPPAPAEAPSGT
jgi:cell division septation protein DedD